MHETGIYVVDTIDKKLNSIDPLILKWTELSCAPNEVHLGIYYHFPPLTALHGHDFYEMFLILEGQLLHNTGKKGATREMGAGRLQLIRPGDLHGFSAIDSKSVTMANLAFSSETFEELLGFTGLTAERDRLTSGLSQPGIRLTSAQLQAETHLLRTLFAQPLCKANPALRALLAQWLSELVLPLETASDTTPAWLSELCMAMVRKENFLQGVSRLQELAGRSPAHISRSFRRHLHQTPSAFVNTQKLAYACELLASENLPIIEVALESGFSDAGYFNRLFKNRYQCTPRTFRAQCRNTLP